MIVAYHAIFAAHGFWLPNDPRGSWSEFVALWDLFLFGGSATKTSERRSLARRSHDRQRRIDAKRTLKYSPVVFDGKQALAIIHVEKNPIRAGLKRQKWSFVRAYCG